MPFLEKANLKLYYEDTGEGEAIITNHGLVENSSYWSESGVTAKLTERYRVISMDMRGHGRTVVSRKPYGFDAGTMGNDFGLLADHLGIDRFHILTHASGGMAALRYAMSASERLSSLMLTDTGSATQIPFDPMPEDEQEQIWKNLAENGEMYKFLSVEERYAQHKANSEPFMTQMNTHPESDRLWKIYKGFLEVSDPVAIGEFMQCYYSDSNPMVEGLRQIKCPSLVLLGEFDAVFIRPSEIMAKEIPDNRHIILKGVGHMTAMEAPDRTSKELLNFLETVRETGKANR